jgi:hypothetical protein
MTGTPGHDRVLAAVLVGGRRDRDRQPSTGDFFESGRTLALAGAELVILPAAYETAAERWWDLLYPAQALGNAQWWVMTDLRNRAGSAISSSPASTG